MHEVLPITAGCRATLIYNLLRKGKGGALKPSSYERETARAKALLDEWGNSKTAVDDGLSEQVVYPLEHAYSPAELDFANLKGVDAAVAALLKSAGLSGAMRPSSGSSLDRAERVGAIHRLIPKPLPRL